MELSWSDNEVPLSLFVERFNLPQIVQIGEGLYGETDETTLSRGQELNLHFLKDTQFYSGVTETGEELHIPLNSPHKVHVFSEKSLEKYDSPRELSALFPQKYKHVRLQCSQVNSSDNTETIEAGETLRALYFDKYMKHLVCLDKHGCEVTLEMHQLSEIKGIEKNEEPVFIAEVYHRFSLPLTVQFIPQTNSSVQLKRGLIHLKKVIVKQTVVATSRDVDCASILTVPSTLDVTVIAPQEATLAHPEYRTLCENLNMNVNLKKVEETIEKDEEFYDDVKACVVKVIPYAEAFFGSRATPDSSAENNNNNIESDDYLDEDNYVDIDRTFFTLARPVEVTRQENRSTTLPATRSETSLPTSRGTSKQKSNTNRSTTLPATRSETSLLTSPDLVSPGSTSFATSPTTTSPGTDASHESNEGKDDDDDDDDIYEMPEARPNEYEKPTRTRIKVIEDNRKTEDFTVQEIGMLLRDLHLGQYGGVFEREQVDGRILKDLDKEMLQSHFNMTPFHAHKLKKAAMENWRPTVTD